MSGQDAELKSRFKASMLLAGVGDAIGYKNGEWEFCRSGVSIHDELVSLGGLDKIAVNPHQWMVSDDTVMHLATAEALVSQWTTKDKLYDAIATKYKECFRDMAGRAPGLTCGHYVHQLRPGRAHGCEIPFNERGGGCGAAMRSAPIGLYYHRPEDLDELVAVSIESGRMTHNHPTGYLGSLATALFVSYSVQKKPLVEWGAGLLETLDCAMAYIKQSGKDVELNKKHWHYFKDCWMQYLDTRGIRDGKSSPVFPVNYSIKERDAFYKKLSFSGTGGASGHDAPMIAYDALLGSDDSWSELCSRSMLHGGDSDSTGIIAAACWGAMNGLHGVPLAHYKNLEYRDRLERLGGTLFDKTCSK